MEYAYYSTSGALALAASRVAHSAVKSWWRRYRLKKDLIARASQQQFEIQHHPEADEYEELEQTVRRKPVRRHGGVFRNYLVQEGKAKFGTPTRSSANTLVVRKYLYDKCREHGVLARHINENLDFAVEMVFVPSENELIAAAVRHTESTKLRCSTYEALVGPRPTLA